MDTSPSEDSLANNVDMRSNVSEGPVAPLVDLSLLKRISTEQVVFSLPGEVLSNSKGFAEVAFWCLQEWEFSGKILLLELL